jgi:thiamine pyrophosphokinase
VRQTPALSLPDADIYSLGGAGQAPNRKTLFVLGGRPPALDWLKDLAGRNHPEVWAVDGGVAVCRAADLSPDELIGDRDSASPEDWEWALSKGANERLYEKDKDRTDFQLAMSVFEEAGRGGDAKRVLLASGCFGGAFDHLFSLFCSLASGEGNYFRCMADNLEGAFFIRSGESAAIEFSRAPTAVSLLPATETCGGVCVSGVKWPLRGVTLERKYPWTVSNETIKNATGAAPVTVSCEEGTCAVYWRF